MTGDPHEQGFEPSFAGCCLHKEVRLVEFAATNSSLRPCKRCGWGNDGFKGLGYPHIPGWPVRRLHVRGHGGKGHPREWESQRPSDRLFDSRRNGILIRFGFD